MGVETMDKIDILTSILRRVDAGENPTRIREESKDFLLTVEPTDVVLAEQSILNSGCEINDIARMCRSHISLIGNPVEKLRLSLPPGHVLQRLLAEHQMVQCLLVDLISLNAAIGKLEYISATAPEYMKLLHIVSHLSAGEQHLDIEEKAIFPQFKKLGIYVLPKILASEHFDLRFYTEQLQELVYNCSTMDFDRFKRGLDKVVLYIVPLKREHIFKEDNMLYPIAFETIHGDSDWNRLHSMCEHIGYCCF
jgi:DUF438 domain-containing protein